MNKILFHPAFDGLQRPLTAEFGGASLHILH